MKSFAVLFAAALAVAAPIATRSVGGLLLCSGANSTGLCKHDVYELGTCYDVPLNTTTTNTFAPDGESFYCLPYAMSCGGICTSPQGCTLGPVDFDYPNKNNLSAVGWSGVESFVCHPKK